MLKCSRNCPTKELPFVSIAQRTRAINRRLVTTKESTRRPLPVCFLAVLCHHQAVVSAFFHFSVFPVCLLWLMGWSPPAPPNQPPRPLWVNWTGLAASPPHLFSCHGGINCVVLVLEHFWTCVFGDAVAVYRGVTGAPAAWPPAGLWSRRHRTRVGLLMEPRSPI